MEKDDQKNKFEYVIHVPFSVALGKWEGKVTLTITSNDPSLNTMFDEKTVLIQECVDKLIYKVFEDKLVNEPERKH